jgi:hypothetical protein
LNRAKSIASSQQHHAFAPTRDVLRVATPARASDRPGTTAGALLRPPVPRAPRGTRRGIGRHFHRLSHPPARATRTPAAPPDNWRRCRTPPHVFATLCPYLDVRDNRDFFTKVPAPIYVAGARRPLTLHCCQAAAVAPWVPYTPSSRVRSFSQPFNHASVFPKPCRRACRRLLPRPGHILTGATAPAVAAA